MPRVSFYKEYWGELNEDRFPLSVQHRLNTFLRWVAFDPDDAALIAVCQVTHVMFRRVYGYPLGQGYVVFWRVKREKSSAWKWRRGRPIRVEVLAIDQP